MQRYWSPAVTCAYDPVEKHGFISTQKMGIEVFKNIPKDCKVIVATGVWQYSYHVLAGLRDHTGPILTVANWTGTWPGLVGMLNLNLISKAYLKRITRLPDRWPIS